MKIIKINIPKIARSSYGQTNSKSSGGGGVTIIGGGGGGVTVIDSLTSSSIDSALSANQGRVLNEKITNINSGITDINSGITEVKNTVDTVSKNIDVINVTDLSNNTCYSSVGDAVKWLSDNAQTYHYTLHCGMSVKYRDYSTGKWLTYLYIGSSTDWKDANYNVAANWVFHAREKNIDIIDNLESKEKTEALSANQGRILNQAIADLDKKYLSKVNDDTANGVITFNKGLISDANISVHGYNKDHDKGTAVYSSTDVLKNTYSNVISDHFKARNTITTPTAIITEEIKSDDHILDEQGWSIYKDEDGHFNLDIDNANVRGRLDVETLVVEEAKYVGGKLYCTKAGMVCNGVEDKGTYYRCFFKTTNAEGLTIHNQFEINDQAFSQTFNNNKLRRWWRLVVGIGDNYIDVSKDDCESKSDSPQSGDSIVQLGNRTLEDRQGALIIEPLKLNIYNGIKEYKLPAHIISLNPTQSEIKAKFINSATNEDITTTFENLGDRITAISSAFTFDEQGNITNINKSGLVSTADFNELFSQQLNAHDEVVTEAKLGTYNYVDNGELESAIAGVTSKLKYDENGNLTNIDKSGLVITSDFSTLFSQQLNEHNELVTEAKLGTYNYVDNGELESAIAGVTSKIKYDDNGDITNISKSGLVVKDDFSTLFSQQLNEHNELVTESKLGTYNYVDNGELESAIAGVTSKLKYDENGNLTNIDKSGLVATSDFAGLFSTQLNAHDEVITSAKLGTYNYVDNGELESAIAGVTENLHYDSDGNLTNISKNGLVLSSEFAGLFTTQLNAHNEVVTKTVLGTYNYVDNGQLESAIAGITSGLNYDEDGNLTNISKNGLVLSSDFSTLFSAAVDADGNIVKSSQISTFIDTDEANNLISNATIQADKINFLGKTIINDNFIVDTQGNLSVKGKIEATEGKIGNFDITEKGLNNNYAGDNLKMAEIVITDSSSGEMPQYRFHLGGDVSKKAMCNIDARGGTALDISTEGGTCIETTVGSDKAWSIYADDGRSRLSGFHCNARYMATADDTMVKLNDDFVIFGYTVPTEVRLPVAIYNGGKIYYFKLMNKKVTLRSDNIIAANSTNSSPTFVLDRIGTYMFISDGVKWFQIS